ncbi:MAG: roadblock/LC7 domain-containing protein [Candidatus Asgardarchaeia archaeon]
MSQSSLAQKLKNVLVELETMDPEIEASAVIRSDGLLMASNFKVDIDKNLVAAMNAAVLNISKRAASELKKGKLQELTIRAEKGIIVITSAAENIVLSSITKPDANLGLLLFELKKATNKIQELLE